MSTITTTLPATASTSQGASAQVPGTTPTWLARATPLGRASDSAPVSMRVYLAPKGGIDALRSAAAAVSAPGNANYRKFLTAAQYQQRYAPTADEVAAVRAWLQGAGLTATVAAHNQYLTVHGTVAQASKAFGTTINRYRHDGQTVQAPASALKMPVTLARSVSGITGLDTTAYRSRPQHVGQGAPASTGATRSAGSAKPADDGNPTSECSTYFGENVPADAPAFKGQQLPLAVCGYTNKQLHDAYLPRNGYTGKDVTVAIVDACASATIQDDAARLAAEAGGQAYVDGQYSEDVLPTTPGECTPVEADGWAIEQSLDVEAVHAMAPDARIRYYGAGSSYDSDMADAVQAALDEDIADVISLSWAAIEDPSVNMEYLFIEALLQGISVVASSGDSGDNFDIGNGYYVPGVLAPNYPASSPLVTAVGGTALGIDAAGNRTFETAWGSHYEVATANNGWSDYGFVEGSGGGSSILFRKPWYQQSVAPNSTMRSVPDVAMDADPSTGMRIGLTLDGTWYSFPEGGTSLSAPLFAGMTAVSLEYAADRVHSHVRMGFLNPLIYNAPAAFTDVQGTAPVAGVIYPGGSANGSAAVFTFDEPSLTQHVTAGWDNATGLGVPNVGWVVAPWHVLAPAPTSASGTGSLIS